MFFLSHLLSGWNALAERCARYCSPFVARIMWPLAVARISWMSGHFFSCLRTLRFPLSECFMYISMTDFGVKSRVKLVSRAVPHDCTQLCEGCDPSLLGLPSLTRDWNCVVYLFLSKWLIGFVSIDHSCRRVLTPRCSMPRHLLKEQARGGIEPPTQELTMISRSWSN